MEDYTGFPPSFTLAASVGSAPLGNLFNRAVSGADKIETDYRCWSGDGTCKSRSRVSPGGLVSPHQDQPASTAAWETFLAAYNPLARADGFATFTAAEFTTVGPTQS